MRIKFWNILWKKSIKLEDGMKKFALIAILVVIAVVLGTCDMFEDVEEWTDVEYEADINGVKSVKLYLQPDGMDRSVLPGPDTYGVRVSPEQRRIIRALTADTAAASHDFFEAVFYCSGTKIVRTTWEIGYPAGISGGLLDRGATNTATTHNYAGFTTAGRASTVFVGRQTNKTLLGVGFLTQVNDANVSATTGYININAYSVTYTIAPIKTWLGFRSGAGVTPGLPRVRTTIYGDGDDDTTTGIATFTTDVTAGGGGSNRALTVVQGLPAVTYPLYTRRATAGPMETTYRIGGLAGITQTLAGTPYGPVTLAGATSTLSAGSPIRVYGTQLAAGGSYTTYDPDTGETGATPRGGMQVIKRTPTLLYQGRTYGASQIYDSFTTLGGVNGTLPVVNNTHGDGFATDITITFNVTAQSSGIFAFTFQCPVYAITTLNARQSGDDIDANNRFVKWFIRPADGANLYYLDSGTDEGGMVMIGDTQSFSNDWIEIKTTGIGFQNN
jgi:hypothetical protein